MDSALIAAMEALAIMVDPWRLAMISVGVVLGLILGILPGIGGLAGTALILPLTFGMDPYTAFALLLGVGAVTSTGDPIPAILFGIPGSSGSAATVLDGLPMARRGEAGRALSAAYMSSLLGGLFGALFMGALLPVMRPMMLYVGAPEILAFTVLGLSMVSSLSGNTPLRGTAIACLGLMISMVGQDPQTATLRWTFDSLYLWEGVPLIALVLGLFALPELADLAIGRTSIASEGTTAKTSLRSMVQGAKDSFRNWFLVLRCSWIGAFLGSLPGVSGSIVDWIAYGHALRTVKGAPETFGKGDVRGVIAAESANNAREGGALVPTIAFGVPGSATMAILLGAFMIHGLVPGPEMLTTNLSITYSMVWTIAIANILGAGLCYAFSGQFAKLSVLRYTLIIPSLLAIVYIGAYQGSSDPGDFITLLLFGVLGWVMKQLKWPRAPLILGVVLGEIVERNLFISIGRYGWTWLERPVVAVIFLIAIFILISPLIKDVRRLGGIKHLVIGRSRPRFQAPQLFTMFILVVFVAMLATSLPWPSATRIIPICVGTVGTIAVLLSLLNQVFPAVAYTGKAYTGKIDHSRNVYMDLEADTKHLSRKELLRRAFMFFSWLVGMLVLTELVGLMVTIPIFVVCYMRFEGREKWRVIAPYAFFTTLFIYILFERFLTIHWPSSWLGTLFPALSSSYSFF